MVKLTLTVEDDGRVLRHIENDKPVAAHVIGMVCLNVAHAMLNQPNGMIPSLADRLQHEKAAAVAKDHPAKWITSTADDLPIVLCEDCKAAYGSRFTRPIIRLPADGPAQPCHLCLDPVWIPPAPPQDDQPQA